MVFVNSVFNRLFQWPPERGVFFCSIKKHIPLKKEMCLSESAYILKTILLFPRHIFQPKILSDFLHSDIL